MIFINYFIKEKFSSRKPFNLSTIASDISQCNINLLNFVDYFYTAQFLSRKNVCNSLIFKHSILLAHLMLIR